MSIAAGHFLLVQDGGLPRRLLFVETFLKYSAGWWAVIVTTLLTSLITRTSYFDGNKTQVYEVTVPPVVLVHDSKFFLVKEKNETFGTAFFSVK